MRVQFHFTQSFLNLAMPTRLNMHTQIFFFMLGNNDAILQFNNHIPQSAALSIPNLSAHMPSQKKLSDLMEEVQFSSLLEKSSLADRARLLSITSPHAAAWISVTPSISQGLRLLPNEFQVAVQWWLGINQSPHLVRMDLF